MVTHWESSRKPLYIRTIWKDGQHHVVLDKSEEIHSKRPKQYCSSHRTTKSASALPSTNPKLRVSSVRMAFSGIKRFKNAQNENSRTWTRPISHLVARKDLNKEVNFDQIQGFKPPIVRKNSSESSETYEMEKYHPDNALSEKVMLWLDLAMSDCQPKQSYPVTAPVCLEESSEEDILEEEDTDKAEDLIVYSEEEEGVPTETFCHILSPSSSYEHDNVGATNTAKRQLHIFMPNLPKKSSDCDSSILSSQISVN